MRIIRERTYISRLRTSLFSITLILTILSAPVVIIARSQALQGTDFNAGNIISGAVFSNTTTMSVADIQNFLNSKVPTCDTYGSLPSSHPNGSGGYYTRAQWGAIYDSTYGTSIAAAPYVCLKDYVENPATGQSNLQNPGLNVPGGISAALIIYNAAQQYQINPEVLLVTLQKEQGLITDDWPWVNEYQEAMGYDCPDTPQGCSSSYSGFYTQVTSAAQQYRNYLDNPNNFNYTTGNNTIDYAPPSQGCALSSTVNIQNQATAALYDYTPYQPDSSVIANTNPTGSSSGPGGSVSGDSCATYGNRNFWWYFTTWFGSTQTTTPYAWIPVSQSMYADSQLTQQFSNEVINLTPGSKAYLQVQARNNGNQPWSQSIVHLGTARPNDRSSVFSDGSWLSATRIQMQQTSVAPGDIGTFNFSITAPQSYGEYNEYFDLVADGIVWMNDPGLYFRINVVNPHTTVRSTNIEMTSNQTMLPNQYIMSSDGSTTLQLTSDGWLQLRSNGQQTWGNGVSGSTPKLLAMQPDGNLVEYSSSGSVLWSSGTSGNPNAFLVVQPDGNLVIYSSSGTALWDSGTPNVPSFQDVAFYTLPGGVLLPGQGMSTPQGDFHLELQHDGNLVLYKNGVPLWASGTAGQSISNLSMQPDGNLVLYNTAGNAVWYSATAGNDGSYLAVQSDGNVVIYSSTGNPVWSTSTNQ